MAQKKTMERMRRLRRAGRPASGKAKTFVRKEMKALQHGKSRVKSRKQAVAVGVGKARRSGVKMPPRKTGSKSERIRKSAARAYDQRARRRRAAAERKRITLSTRKRAGGSKHRFMKSPRSVASRAPKARSHRR